MKKISTFNHFLPFFTLPKLYNLFLSAFLSKYENGSLELIISYLHVFLVPDLSGNKSVWAFLSQLKTVFFISVKKSQTFLT